MARSEKSLSSLGQPLLGSENHPRKYLRKPPIDMFWIKLLGVCSLTTIYALTVGFSLISADEGEAFLSRKNTDEFLTKLETVKDCSHEIWVIRHGERSESGLSPTGYARAEHLSNLIEDRRWPRFVGLFATNWTNRESQTLVNVSSTLNHSIRDHYGINHTDRIREDVMSTLFAPPSKKINFCEGGKRVVLISWEHCTFFIDQYECEIRD